MRNAKFFFWILIIILFADRIHAQSSQGANIRELSKVTFQKIGRGDCHLTDSNLVTRNAYAAIGQQDWKNYEFTFRARVPASADQVQICAGFWQLNRDDRYILLLRGGNQRHLYLARLGYMGTDDFLALRTLDFQPVPGKWYTFRIQVVDNRIRIFLNNESLPRIDVIDPNSHYAPTGMITLGGSWITNEFDSFHVKALENHTLEGVKALEYAVPPANKERLRRLNRAAYQPIVVKNTPKERSVINLDGSWLFKPGYEISDELKAISPAVSDTDWHTIHVPDFWNPLRVWQHGERYNSSSKGVSDNYWEKEIARCELETFDYKRTSTGWYRQWVDLPEGTGQKRFLLNFDAISKIGEIWINGKKAGMHIGMFGDTNLDITSLLHTGKNLIAVKVSRDFVKDIQNANRVAGVAVTVEVTEKMLKDIAHGFFDDDPAGIWQPVSLTITNPVHIHEVFIKPDLTGASIEVTLRNDDHQPQQFSLQTVIAGAEKSDILYRGMPLQKLSVGKGETSTFSFSLSGLKPRLWSPEHPNLYRFEFRLLTTAGKTLTDHYRVTSGFRTFKTAGGYLYLNGHRYWLRGANQTAMPLAPNDSLLADKFSKLMKAGNEMVTRTHTVPYTETWMNASDVNGIAVSYEGTWPWLFLEKSYPDEKLIGLWREEFLSLLKKYRNHPSLVFWTVNNEMKFYDNDPDSARTRLKMKVISDVVKAMRKIDPTRPVVFDSNYRRYTKKFGTDYFKQIDDGDIDDPHAYYNWYDYSIFQFFNGEWEKRYKNPGRPLISQEMSTGYTDETGHPSRYYTYVHQNPESLAGKYVYEYNDPYYFLTAQAFISKELAEALRRSNPHASGILHFSALTWFKNVYQADRIAPWPVYYEMKKALQPVLISAELWGRHFYAGEPLATRFCLINDREDGTLLPAGELKWELKDQNGKTFASGRRDVPPVEHYGRYWFDPQITIPKTLGEPKFQGSLKLVYLVNQQVISENSYDLVFAGKESLGVSRINNKKFVLVDPAKTYSGLFDRLGIKYTLADSPVQAKRINADAYIFVGLDSSGTDAQQVAQLRGLVTSGQKILVIDSKNIAARVFPEYIRGKIKDVAEVANMDIPESPIFDGIEPLEVRNFNNTHRELPSVMDGAYRVSRSPKLSALASYTRIHGYLNGKMEERSNRLDQIKGFPLVQIQDQGTAMLTTLQLDKAATDPVAGKLLINMLSSLTK